MACAMKERITAIEKKVTNLHVKLNHKTGTEYVRMYVYS